MWMMDLMNMKVFPKRQKSTTSKDITRYTISTQPSLRYDLSIKSYKFDADECR
ncbi:hypothetical protein Goshw_018054, partial [Gossypium schwendimanii]|nr:hypothetical protein [Gossypium schwendimanii]